MSDSAGQVTARLSHLALHASACRPSMPRHAALVSWLSHGVVGRLGKLLGHISAVDHPASHNAGWYHLRWLGTQCFEILKLISSVTAVVHTNSLKTHL